MRVGTLIPDNSTLGSPHSARRDKLSMLSFATTKVPPAPFREVTAVRVFQPLRCWICCWIGLQTFQVDLKPYQYDSYRFPRQPLFACYRCLPEFKADPRVARIIRLLRESEIAT